jgi:hypothetical protein
MGQLVPLRFGITVSYLIFVSDTAISMLPKVGLHSLPGGRLVNHTDHAGCHQSNRVLSAEINRLVSTLAAHIK